MDNHNLKIGFIGGGNMAQAIISGLVLANHPPQCLAVSDPDQAQLECIHAINGDINVLTENNTLADEADIVVLAVKPQIIGDIIQEISGRASCLYLSIAAGITLDTLQKQLTPARAIVRIMPNQPALVGAGMSVLTATAATSSEQKATAQYIAEAMGNTAWVDDEPLMDAVTAVSGSGPAYFYLFMEIIEACARDMGLPAELAGRLARQTCLGAGIVAAESDLELEVLRASVTSKGGTTAAAIEVLEQSDFRAIVARALLAARDRSVELGTAD